MLVLSRRKNEAIHIGRNVVVRVLSVQGSTVRLGIEAPPEVAVHREEVRERLEAEARAVGPLAPNQPPAPLDNFVI